MCSRERRVTERKFTWALPESLAEEWTVDLSGSSARLEHERQPFTPPEDEQLDYESAAFEPLTVIVGTVAITYLIRSVIRAVRDVRHGGAVIDTRDGRLDVRSHPAVPGGTVLVVGESGVTEYREPADANIESIVAHISSSVP
jgi:hypothetical protein